MRVRSVLSAVLVTLILYYAHRLLQLQYYRRCKADLIRVVLFNQSTMCTHIANVLQLVEMAYQQVVKQATAQVLAALGAGAGAGLGGGFLEGVLANLGNVLG
jgi:hypothetical protein